MAWTRKERRMLRRFARDNERLTKLIREIGEYAERETPKMKALLAYCETLRP